MAYKFVGVVAILLAIQVSTILACDDYELVVSDISSCPGVVNTLVTFKNFNVTINSDCKVTPTGRVTYKSFTSAKLDIDILFRGRKERRIRQTVDFCDRLKNAPPIILDPLKARNLSTSCPIQGKSVVTDDFIVDISKYKQFLGIGVGSIYGKIKTTYDETGVSCYTFNSTLKLKEGVPKKKVDRIAIMKGLRDLMVQNGGSSGGGGGSTGGESGGSESGGGGGKGGFGFGSIPKKWFG